MTSKYQSFLATTTAPRTRGSIGLGRLLATTGTALPFFLLDREPPPACAALSDGITTVLPLALPLTFNVFHGAFHAAPLLCASKLLAIHGHHNAISLIRLNDLRCCSGYEDRCPLI
jgi:hypothetical protein